MKILLAVISILFSVTAWAQGIPVQPQCDGNWHWVDSPGAMCMDGSPTGFEYACSPSLGPTGPLMIYFEPGGGIGSNYESVDCDFSTQACLQGVCCTNPQATMFTNHNDKSMSCDGQPYGACQAVDSAPYTPIPGGDIGQSAAFNSPTSPFNPGGTGSAGLSKWNMAVFAYCTADGYAGSATAPYVDPAHIEQPIVAHLKGYRNVSIFLNQMSQILNPSQVALWGSSAGSFGVICNLSQVVSTFPQTTAAFVNSFPPLSAKYEQGLTAYAAQLGAAKVLPNGTVQAVTCPLLCPAGGCTSWDPSLAALYDQQALPGVRLALTDDYSDSTINAFSNIVWGCTGSGACGDACSTEPCNSMVDFEAEATRPNLKYYWHTGQCHAEREADLYSNFAPGCSYDDMIQNGISFNNWVRGWMGIPGFSWDNVR